MASGPPRRSAPRDVDEHMAHQARGHGEEVLAVLPADRIPAKKPHAQLVDQSGRLQADGRSLAQHVAGSHAVQLLVDERQDPVECIRVAVAPGAEQLRDFAAAARIWWTGHRGVRPV